MAKFISIPTQMVGQPNVLFNTDNITAVIPPATGDTSATGAYCKIYSPTKSFNITFGGATGAAKNTNALAGATVIANAIASANAAPVCTPVNFYTVGLTEGSGATAQTTITVKSTSGLVAGMVVTVVGGGGVFASNTTISSVTNSTQFVVSAAPTTALSNATIAAAVLTVTLVEPTAVA